MVTELIFSNCLKEYEPDEMIALLSCFVFQEKNSSGEHEPNFSQKLKDVNILNTLFFFYTISDQDKITNLFV